MGGQRQPVMRGKVFQMGRKVRQRLNKMKRQRINSCRVKEGAFTKSWRLCLAGSCEEKEVGYSSEKFREGKKNRNRNGAP